MEADEWVRIIRNIFSYVVVGLRNILFIIVAFVREVIFLIIDNWQPLRNVTNNHAIPWDWIVIRNTIYKRGSYCVLEHSALLRYAVVHIEAKRSDKQCQKQYECNVLKPFHI